MNNVDLNKAKATLLFGGGALVALATWGVWAFCGGGLAASSGSESAFDGWFYGREDQKAASAALAAAGLDDWEWDAEGRLLVPKNKKNEYQTALAAAGAYPKAPSESRRDAIREMGAFESEAKMRMRDLAACAFQLERTLERTVGIEYATVGVRSRREPSGLSAKTVVTASVGVACREGFELDAELLSAITVATKHLLGVESNENVSILDLKAGKTYFGSEKSVGNGLELALAAEKERVEIYWRDKLEKTFDYMKGVRVAVAAELAAVGPDESGFEEARNVAVAQNERNVPSGLDARDAVEPRTRRTATAAERLATVEIDEIEKPRPLAVLGDLEKSGERTVAARSAYARLGNPVASRAGAVAKARREPVEASELAAVDRTAPRGAGIRSVGATESKERAGRGVVLAGYRSENEKENENEGANVVRTEADGANVASVRNVEKTENAENEAVAGTSFAASSVGRTRFRVRALAVRVGTPRGYVRRVAQNLRAENAGETFANDDGNNDWRSVYRATEQKIIGETKNVALALLRPFAEQNGWSEDELARSVVVDVFADPRDFNDRSDFNGREGGAGSANALDGGGKSGALEVVANFGRVARTSGTIAEESTGDAEPVEIGATSDAAASDFWKRLQERARRFDRKTGAIGVGLAILAILTGGTIAARRRRKRRLVERSEENAALDASETPVAENKRKKRPARIEETARAAREREDAASAGNKKETPIGENAPDRAATSDAKTVSTRGVRDGWNARNRVGTPGGSSAFRESGVGRESGNAVGAPDVDDDWDNLDDWEDDLLEIRALVERERERVDGGTTERRNGRSETASSDEARRREALDLVARNPERAAASLRRWIRPGA